MLQFTYTKTNSKTPHPLPRLSRSPGRLLQFRVTSPTGVPCSRAVRFHRVLYPRRSIPEEERIILDRPLLADDRQRDRSTNGRLEGSEETETEDLIAAERRGADFITL